MYTCGIHIHNQWRVAHGHPSLHIRVLYAYNITVDLDSDEDLDPQQLKDEIKMLKEKLSDQQKTSGNYTHTHVMYYKRSHVNYMHVQRIIVCVLSAYL